MEVLFQLAAAAVTGAVCAVLLKKQEGELALLLALCTCGVLLHLVLDQIGTLVALIRELVDLSGVDNALVEPLLKTVAAAIVTTLTASVAKDAGQTAIATAVQLAGSIVALCLGVPLVRAVLSLMAELL